MTSTESLPEKDDDFASRIIEVQAAGDAAIGLTGRDWVQLLAAGILLPILLILWGVS